MQIQHQATPPAAPGPARRWSPLALGFRPFFLAATLAALGLMAVWPLMWLGLIQPPLPYDVVGWHGHEMLFGYAVAVVAGFLLTAVRNWTGVQTWSGGRLAALVMLWLAGRCLPWFGFLPWPLLALLDVAFLPVLAASLARPLWSDRNRVNRWFVPLLLAMALANLGSHLQMAGMLQSVGDSHRIMLILVLLLIVWVAGRVLPFFTRNVIAGFEPATRVWVERLSFGVLMAVAPLQLAGQTVPPEVQATLWILFGLLQFVQLAGWFDRRVLAMPVLWVLHLGYAWLALGGLLTGIAGFDGFPANLALHALTMGAVGTVTLGMMARVARGHTGRPIAVTTRTATAFTLFNLGVLVRVLAPFLLPEQYARWIELSAGLWLLAFALFVMDYAGMLLQPRLDGKPG